MAAGISTRLNPRELRRFGVTVAIPLTLLTALGAWRGHTILPAILGGLAAILGSLAFLAPRFLGPVHTVWMAVAHALGWFNTRVLLGLVYFLVMTPTGVVMRLLGCDPLDRRLYDRSTYWIPHEKQTNPQDAMKRRF